MQNTQSHPNGNGSTKIIDIANSLFSNMGVEERIEDAGIFCQAEPYLSIIQAIFPQSSHNLAMIDRDTRLNNSQKIQAVITLLQSLIDNDLSHISGVEIAKGKESHIVSLLQIFQALTSNSPQGSEASAESALSSKGAKSQPKGQSQQAVMAPPKQSQSHNNAKQDKLPKQKPSQRKGKSKAEIESNSQSDFPIKPIQAYKKHDYKQQENRHSPANNKKVKQVDLASTASSHALSNEMGLRYKKQNKQMVSLIRQLFKAQQNLQIERGSKLQGIFVQEQRELQRQRYRSARKIEGEANKRKQFMERKMDDRSKMLQSLQSGHHFSKNIRSIFKQQSKVKREEKQRQIRQQQRQAKDLLDFGVLDDLLQKAIDSNSRKSSSHRHK